MKYLKDTDGNYWRADQFWMLTIDSDDYRTGGLLPDGSFVTLAESSSEGMARQKLFTFIHALNES